MAIDLHGQNVLVTRPLPQGDTLCQLIENAGGHAIAFPTIAFEEVNFDEQLPLLGAQDWLLFISPQAVFSAVPSIRRAWPDFPNHVKFAAIGKGTAEALQHAGYNVAYMPRTNKGSEEFLSEGPFKSPAGLNVAIIRGEGGREVVDHALRANGANVLTVIAYKRILPTIDSQLVISQLANIDTIVCTSYACVENLKTLIGADNWLQLHKIPLCVPSERVKKLAIELGFATIGVTSEMSDAAILHTLAENRDK